MGRVEGGDPIISFGKPDRPKIKQKEKAPIIVHGRKTAPEVIARREAEKSAFEKGEDVGKLAEQFGVSKTAINRDRRKLESQYKITYPRPKKGGPIRKPSPETIARRQKIKSLLERGDTPREIAKQFGISQGVVYNDRQIIEKENDVTFARGVKIQVVKSISPEVAARMQKEQILFEKRVPIPKIAEEFNISPSTVYKDRRKIEKKVGVVFERSNLLRQREERGATAIQRDKPKETISVEPPKERPLTKTPSKSVRSKGPSEQRRARWEKALQLRAQDLTDKQIGEALGLKESTVASEWQYMKKEGIVLGERSKGRRPVEVTKIKKRVTIPKEKQVSLLAADKTAREIAAQMGTTTRAVQQRRTILRKQGEDIPKRRSGRVPSEEVKQKMLTSVRLKDEGKSNDEIARATGIPRHLVASYIYRARKVS